MSIRTVDLGKRSDDTDNVAGNSHRIVEQALGEVFSIERYLHAASIVQFPRTYHYIGTDAPASVDAVKPDNLIYTCEGKKSSSIKADLEINGPSSYKSTNLSGLAIDFYECKSYTDRNQQTTVKVQGDNSYTKPRPNSGICVTSHANDVQAQDVVVMSLGTGNTFRSDPNHFTTAEDNISRALSVASALVVKLRYRSYKTGLEETIERTTFTASLRKALKYRKSTSNCFLVTNVKNLRRQNIVISEGLSWERTVEELIVRLNNLLVQNPNDNPYSIISSFEYLVITFGLSAAVLVQISAGKIKNATLICATNEIEGDFQDMTYGSMRGSDTIMTSAISLCVGADANPTYEKCVQAVKNGLRGMRFEYYRGFTRLHQTSKYNMGRPRRLKLECASFMGHFGHKSSPILYHPTDPVGHILRHKMFADRPSIIEDVFWIRDVKNDVNGTVRRYLKQLTDQVQRAWDNSYGVTEMDVPVSYFESGAFPRDWSFIKASDPTFDINGPRSTIEPIKSADDLMRHLELLKRQPEWKIAQDIIDGSMVLKKGIKPKKGELDKVQLAVPVLSAGGLTLYDRTEVEQFREIKTQIKEYTKLKYPKHAYNILVLGEPGSGKSFGVKQLLSTLPREVISESVIDVNLSSLESREGLAQYFHQARDISISGKIPVMFFDEFDANRDKEIFGWAQVFLSPMWDLKVADRLQYVLGKSILIFAGSRYDTIDGFMQAMALSSNYRSDGEKLQGVLLNVEKDDFDINIFSELDMKIDKLYGESITRHSSIIEELSAALSSKAIDFKSRFTGSIDVLGVNPSWRSSRHSEYSFIIKRALILRGFLDSYKSLFVKGGLQIQDSLVDAFLGTSRYLHGARSIEHIVLASSLHGVSFYDAVALPSDHMLRMHIPSLEAQTEFSHILRY